MIYLFRHGETDWNAEGRFQGQLDVPLNDKGREQARALIPQLKEARIEAILSSDLVRAFETGQIVASALQIPISADLDLREAHLGDAQGLTVPEIQKRLGVELVARWKSNLPTDADVGYPGGETGSQVIQRVFRAMERFLDTRAFERVAISTHGGVIRRVMQTLMPPGSPLVPIPNAVVYRIEFDRKSRKFTIK